MKQNQPEEVFYNDKAALGSVLDHRTRHYLYSLEIVVKSRRTLGQRIQLCSQRLSGSGVLGLAHTRSQTCCVHLSPVLCSVLSDMSLVAYSGALVGVFTPWKLAGATNHPA